MNPTDLSGIKGYAEIRRILDAKALRELDTGVVEIGAHGFRHQRLVGLDAETLREETGGARARLEEVCRREVTLFAYPYGLLDDIDKAAESAVRRAGFQAACSTHFGRDSSTEERFRLRRVGVAHDESLREFVLKLEGTYDWVAWKERMGRWIRDHRNRIRESSSAAQRVRQLGKPPRAPGPRAVRPSENPARFYPARTSDWVNSPHFFTELFNLFVLIDGWYAG